MYADNNPVDNTDPFGLCPDPGGDWTPGSGDIYICVSRGGGLPGWLGIGAGIAGWFMASRAAAKADLNGAAALAASQGEQFFVHNDAVCDVGGWTLPISGNPAEPMCFGVPVAGMAGAAGAVTRFTWGIRGHGARHLAGTGLSRGTVENAIRAQVRATTANASVTGSFWGKVTVKGQEIIYRAHTRAPGWVHIGTYHPPR